jgi:malate synthase
VQTLLTARRSRQAKLAKGASLDFLVETQSVRDGDWQVADIPSALRRRHVEITGPVSRKMIINALNSGADIFMADFEDSSAPTFSNMLDGQVNLRDAVSGEIRFVDEARSKHYELREAPATLMVRPRGLHLSEANLRVDDRPIPASLVDFGLYFFHNARAQLDKGQGPYFYLPKLEHHLEARWWNDVFCFAQDRLGLARGSVRATVLIETLPAAFQMDEILWELREHSAGLNCGRWDYIFSFIKTLRADQDFVLPDRAQVGMTQPFMAAYTDLVVKTCHRRGIHAMGGMAAQIPIKNDPEANRVALAKVRADKEREVAKGHDGSWVAHPALVPIAREAFAAGLANRDHQIDRPYTGPEVEASHLLQRPRGTLSEAGLRQNICVGIQYIEAWLGGQGCVPLYNLMEDAATAEISRTQVWQWIARAARLDDGRVVTRELLDELTRDELSRLESELGEARIRGGHFDAAVELFTRLATDAELHDFLTLPGYELLLGNN